MKYHNTYLKCLIGDNGDFVVSAPYYSNGSLAYGIISVWMVPGTFFDDWDN